MNDPRRNTLKERAVIEARRTGMPFRAIASELGIAVSRVHAIWARHERERAAYVEKCRRTTRELDEIREEPA